MVQILRIDEIENITDLYNCRSVQFFLNPSNRKPFQYIIRKSIEFIFTFLALVLVSPILLLIYIAIKFESQGPAMYKQARRGLYNKDFEMYKFRSMVVDAHDKRNDLFELNQSNSVMFKMENDPRVTRVGAFLRKYSLDELPQLFNVLKGEMSLIGPRPPLPEEVVNYQNWHYVRFSAKPGMTGKWQVSGRSKIRNFDDVVRLDYAYIESWSLFEDFKIILKTIPVVLLGKE